MKVYQRYLAREIYSAVTLVLVAFLMLFSFFDFINELQSLGKGSYQLRYMAYFVLLTLPGHIYELAPIAVLIGTLYALTMLAQLSPAQSGEALHGLLALARHQLACQPVFIAGFSSHLNQLSDADFINALQFRIQ